MSDRQGVVLPPTFSNSFWSQEYRTGFESLYNSLENGIVQSEEILSTVKNRISSERIIADHLLPPALRQDGFATDEGASLRMAFEATLTSFVGESKARSNLADELTRSVYLPFSKWSISHAGRIRSSRQTIEPALTSWEKQKHVLERAREGYGESCRIADEMEDELEFVRGREALLRDGGSGLMSPRNGNGSGGGGEGNNSSNGGGVVLPPRPFEIDSALPSSSSSTRLSRSRTHSKQSQDGGRSEDEDSEDGLPPIDNGREEGFIDRTGATGGSVVAALGRALTVRRSKVPTSSSKTGTSVVVESEGNGTGKDEIEGDAQWKGVEKIMEDKNVKAALDFSKTKFSSLLSRVAGPQTGEERHFKARREADLAEERYKREVETLDSLRLTLEELLSTHLPYVQRCESDRLRAATSVLKSFHSAISTIPKSIQQSHERVEQTLELVQVEKDLKLLIERRRTGPFTPLPIMFASHYSAPYLSTFGIDLRKYDETNEDKVENPVPKVLVVLLDEIERRSKNVDEEARRKSWLYETPLNSQHHLRSLLNNPSNLALPPQDLESIFEPFDLAVIAGVVKLWLLELEVPVVPYSTYEELRGLFPARVGSEGREVDKEKLVKAFGKLPRVHLETLRCLIEHLSPLISLSPSTGDSPSTYLSKLSLSMSRSILRPKQITALTLDERFPVVVVGELLKGGKELLKEIDQAAKREHEERYTPRRQRTKPIDVRPTRTGLGLGNRESVDLGQANAVLQHQQQQHAAQPLPAPPVPMKADQVEESDTIPSTTTTTKNGGRGTGSSLKVDTDALAPPVPVVKDGQSTTTEAFAASPMSSLSAFPPETPIATSSSTNKDNEIAQEKEEDHQEEPKEEEIHHDPTPTVSPSTTTVNPGGATETPFVPPTDQEEPLVLPTSTPSTSMSEDKPLVSSTSLKRRSVQQQPVSSSSPSTTTAGGGSGRLRGARAPRPPSSVMAAVQAFEGGNAGGGGGVERGKRESWSRTRVDPGQNTDAE